MQKWFARYFGFSRRELIGVCVLAVVMLLLWVTPNVFIFRNDARTTDISMQIAEIDSFLATAALRSSYTASETSSATDSENALANVTYFKFDPNGLSTTDWERLGLSERQIRMIKNYEAKGGRFRRKEDLAKIYAIDDADYARLAPYIEIKVIESHLTAKAGIDSVLPYQPAALPVVEPTLLLDLNNADSLQLQYLPGIGPVFASRIVRFRKLLGGFHHITQLMDVYGFDSTRYEELKPHVYVDTTKINKIAINTVDYQRLRDHPFINHKLANAIVQYRKQHGPYRSINDLLQIAIMDERIFLKIAPYLTLTDD